MRMSSPWLVWIIFLWRRLEPQLTFWSNNLNLEVWRVVKVATGHFYFQWIQHMRSILFRQSCTHPHFGILNVISAMLYHQVTPYTGWFFDSLSCLTGPAQVGNWIHLIEKNDTGSAQPALRISFDDILLCNYRVIFKISLKYRYRIFFWKYHTILIMRYAL